MRLSQVTVTKKNQKIILQGMIHIAPEKLYRKLQEDVDWATENDFQIFYEGITGKPPEKTTSKNQQQIVDFLELIFEFYPAFAEMYGITEQRKKIKYPQSAIIADISYAQLVEQLDNNGFHCKILLGLLKLAKEINVKETLEKERKSRTSKDFLEEMDKTDKWSLPGMLVKFLFRKALPIILDYRNKKAIEKIISEMGEKNSIVYYGNDHIKGMIYLLQEREWVIVNQTEIIAEEFIES